MPEPPKRPVPGLRSLSWRAAALGSSLVAALGLVLDAQLDALVVHLDGVPLDAPGVCRRLVALSQPQLLCIVLQRLGPLGCLQAPPLSLAEDRNADQARAILSCRIGYCLQHLGTLGCLQASAPSASPPPLEMPNRGCKFLTSESSSKAAGSSPASCTHGMHAIQVSRHMQKVRWSAVRLEKRARHSGA